MAGMPSQPGISETVINNYYDTPAPDTRQAVWDTDTGGNQDPGQDYADNSGQDMSDQDFGGDDSGGDSYDV
jgi:hypothetical protein